MEAKPLISSNDIRLYTRTQLRNIIYLLILQVYVLSAYELSLDWNPAVNNKPFRKILKRRGLNTGPGGISLLSGFQSENLSNHHLTK